MKTRKHYRAIAVLLLLFVAASSLTYWWRLSVDHERQLNLAKERTAQRAQQLAELQAWHLEALFHTFHIALLRFRDCFPNKKSEDLLLEVKKLRKELPEGALVHFSIVNPQGYLIFSTFPKMRADGKSIYFGNREHFKVHRYAKEDRPFIGGPVALRAEKMLAVIISRPIFEANRFNGVAVVSISVKHLSEKLARTEMDKQDSANLFLSDGTFLARSNGWEKSVGTRVSGYPFLEPKAPATGLYHVNAHANEVARTFAWHRLEHFPMIVTIGLNDESILGSVEAFIEQSRIRNLAGTGLAVAVALLLAMMLEWSGRQQFRIDANELRFRDIFNAMSEGVVLRNALGTIIAANPAAEKIYNIPEQELIGQSSLINGRKLYKEDGTEYTQDDHPAMFTLKTGQPIKNQIAHFYDDKNHAHYINFNTTPIKEESIPGVAGVLITFFDVTELKNYENALRKNEQQYREQSQRLSEIIWGTNIGTWEWNVRSGEIQFNDRWAEMLGYELNEITTTRIDSWMTHTHPEDLLRVRKLLDEYFAHKSESYECEMRMRHKNGQWIWVLDRGRVVKWSSNGKPLRMSGTRQDITKRKEIEQALIESQSRLSQIFDSVNDAIFIHDADTGDIVDVNRRMCDMFGFTRDEVIERRMFWKSARPPYSKTEAHMKFQEVLQKGECTYEWLAYRKDGSTLWVEINMRVAQIGNVRRILSVVRDICDRRKAQEKLRLAASVFEGSYEGIMICDANNIVVDINPAFSRITGYSREEIIGKSPGIIASGYQTPEFYEEMWETLQKKGNWHGEIWNRHKNGTVYSEMLSIACIRDDKGAVQNYVAVFTDISQLKEHEAELFRISHYDPLTGAPNRRLLSDRLGQAQLHAKRRNNFFAVCCLDLDGFKPVNDLYGHEAGDRVLVTIVQRIQNVLRSEDTIARLGGDEFVLVLSDLAAPEECYGVLERILAEIRTPIPVPGGTASVSASIGVAMSSSETSDSDVLLRQADQAMYSAKDAGRDRYCVFKPQPE
ncbi:MAG: PAS domain S-box protein [Oxalobacter sp.]|nr:MAG: PAS domain S-box protein [Oxalobacter sp.]